jgi:hypothetical protein
MAWDTEVTADRARPQSSRSDLPGPAEELQTWAECLIRSGIREALALTLFAPGGRHVGFLTLLSGSQQPPPSPAARRRLGRLAPVLAQGIDPMHSLLTAARLVPGARAGAVLRADGGCQPLPGLRADALLVPSSPVVAAARNRVGDGHVCSSFRWPVGGAHGPRRACARHRSGGTRGRAARPDRSGPAVTGGRPARTDPAGTAGAGFPGRGVFQPGDRSHPRRCPADRGRPPGARPEQARDTDEDTRRGPRGTGRSLRSRPAHGRASFSPPVHTFEEVL